MTFKLQLLH